MTTSPAGPSTSPAPSSGSNAAAPTVTVGQLGAGFIGQVHSKAYRTAAAAHRPLGASIELRAISDLRRDLAEAAVSRYEWRSTVEDWQSIVDDPSIVLFDNAAPNDLHLEPCLAAAARGKHILCEKPLAANPDDAYRIWQSAEKAGVLHLCAFMYRFIPAIQHARELIQSGELGEILAFRSTFLLGFALDRSVPLSWRFRREVAGAGALADLGSHHIDLARFLVAEIERVSGSTRIVIAERPGGEVTNDDAFVALADLANGATATFEGSRVAGNHALTSRIEVDGTEGSLAFSLERLNELSVAQRGQHGFRSYLVTQPAHPYADFGFPVGIQGQHPVGWDDCFAHQAHCIISAIAAGAPLPEYAPTFRDGYRVAEVVQAIREAADSRSWETVTHRYRSPVTSNGA